MPAIAYRERFDDSATYEGDDYGDLRELLAPEFRDLPADQLDEALSQLLGEMSAEDLESFWRGVRRFARRAAPVLQQALPVATTVAGTALGGPLGAAVGGAAGQALSGALGGAMSGSGRGAGRRALRGLARGGLRGLGQAAGGLVPGLASLGAAGQRPAAAAHLLRLLTRPETSRALLQMALGPAGAQHVPVGRTQVPLGAFTNALSVLAGQAAQQNHALARPLPAASPVAATGAAAMPSPPVGGGVPTYLLDPAGRPLGDPTDPASRTEALLLRVAEAEALEATEAYGEEYAEAYDETYDEAYAESDEDDFWEAADESDDEAFDSELDEFLALDLAELDEEDW